MKLEELCNCGAKMAVDAGDDLAAVAVLKGWRESHKCG